MQLQLFFSVSVLYVLPHIVVATNPSEIPVADLVSHLNFLSAYQQRTSQINFELGLTYQLLADEVETAAGVSIILLGEDEFRRRAEESYTECLTEDPSNADALSNLANLLSDNHDENLTDSIIKLYERALSSDPLHLQAYLNYGMFLRQQIGRHKDAALIFERGLRSRPSSVTLSFELAFTKELLGENDVATSIYEEILAVHPHHTSALLNAAALYHKRFSIDDAIDFYSRALSTIGSYERDCFLDVQSTDDLFTLVRSPFTDYESQNKEACTCPSTDDVILIFKILSNNGLAFRQLGKYTESIQCFEEVVVLLLACEASSQPSKDLLSTSVDLFLSAKAGCFFSAWDWLGTLLSYLDELDLNDGVIPSLKPFDTLGLPVSPSWKRKVAKLAASPTELAAPRYKSDPTKDEKKLRLGFSSFDFSNHPTTFLFEGIVTANHDNIEILVYSYGPDDGSKARKNIVEKLGDPTDGGTFFDISSMSHEDATRVVCDEMLDIMFDMQGFTLGSRPQLMANRCANIQVNFLAYPGTSGASYIDYAIVDRHVATIERVADEFTEKLAILPRSYQANYFVDPIQIPIRGSAEWIEMRAKEGLSISRSVFVFANLNKQDKIDPSSFSAWLSCLARVPESVLWLLEPSQPGAAEIVKKNLRNRAKDAGILADRLVFAKRVHRLEHIRRMAAGDLFLDTFLYGAHTTATDAMRGGMPLLTLAGDSFSSRVGMSLLHGMNSNKASSLITYSEREFVDAAVEIASAQRAYANSRPSGAKSIATLFIEPDANDDTSGNAIELFDWTSYSRDLDDLSRMMLELKHLTSKNMHLVKI